MQFLHSHFFRRCPGLLKPVENTEELQQRYRLTYQQKPSPSSVTSQCAVLAAGADVVADLSLPLDCNDSDDRATETRALVSAACGTL